MNTAPAVKLLLATNVSTSLLLLSVALCQSFPPIVAGDSMAMKLGGQVMLWAFAPALHGKPFGLLWYWWAVACGVFLWTSLMSAKRNLSSPFKIFFLIWLACGILALAPGTVAGPAVLTGLSAVRHGDNPTAGLQVLLAFLGTVLGIASGAAVLFALPVVGSCWLALNCLVIRSRPTAK